MSTNRSRFTASTGGLARIPRWLTGLIAVALIGSGSFAASAARATAVAGPVAPASMQLPMTGGSKRVVWSVRVTNSGGQRAIDACTGGLTRWTYKVNGKPYYAIHRHCGGKPILSLKKGQVIKISGKKYKVVSSRNIKKGARASVLRGLPGSRYLQTCYYRSKWMRVVGVKRL